MPTSVMPKGVEHSVDAGADQGGRLVMPTSVMPKGVEHLPWRSAVLEVSRMPTSVMPKGVEHCISGDGSDDMNC